MCSFSRLYFIYSYKNWLYQKKVDRAIKIKEVSLMAKSKGFAGWFYSQNFLIQLILLLIPGVNWVVEILVRWSAYLKTKSLLTLVFAILVTIPSGIVIGWLDLVWLLLFRHLLFAKA